MTRPRRPTEVPPSLQLPKGVILTDEGEPAYMIILTKRGWMVRTPQGDGRASSLPEALTLGDLVAEVYGHRTDAPRDAKKAVRKQSGKKGSGDDAEPSVDPRDIQLAKLKETVLQLEHALTSRVTVERAIGVLIHRDRCTPQQAFNSMRHIARLGHHLSVVDVARVIMAELEVNIRP